MHIDFAPCPLRAGSEAAENPLREEENQADPTPEKTPVTDPG
jgi:hypothetical protein